MCERRPPTTTELDTGSSLPEGPSSAITFVAACSSYAVCFRLTVLSVLLSFEAFCSRNPNRQRERSSQQGPHLDLEFSSRPREGALRCLTSLGVENVLPIRAAPGRDVHEDPALRHSLPCSVGVLRRLAVSC